MPEAVDFDYGEYKAAVLKCCRKCGGEAEVLFSRSNIYSFSARKKEPLVTVQCKQCRYCFNSKQYISLGVGCSAMSKMVFMVSMWNGEPFKPCWW